ncbi:hypothetical protein PENANT_c028G10104 [Penicillium antarcticum]|uniref:Uncharacterized protein n=1 Tax=Penicillium antarcticum TaxID=416450 RepID=A0A1V6PWG2_9EURO|nr:hypothetical protein PENANT_c028G10104 [Penicillium antarcticum]
MDKPFSRDYQPVSRMDSDGDNDAPTPSRLQRRTFQSFLKRNLAAITIAGLLLVLALMVLAIIAAIAVEPFRVLVLKGSSSADPADLHGKRQCLPTTTRTTYTCGNSTAEAQALGCDYDPLAGCWLHEKCPHDFTHEFAHFNDGKPFVYYYDEAATRQMKDYNEVGRNPDFYWTSIREHLVHCLYLLRRGHDVHMRGDRLDTMLGDLEHVDHCTDMLANWLRRPDPVAESIGTQGQTHCFMSCS